VKKEHYFFLVKKKDCSIYKHTQLSFEKNVYFLADEMKKGKDICYSKRSFLAFCRGDYDFLSQNEFFIL